MSENAPQKSIFAVWKDDEMQDVFAIQKEELTPSFVKRLTEAGVSFQYYEAYGMKEAINSFRQPKPKNKITFH